MTASALHMWTIYECPRYPTAFVVRRFTIGPGGTPIPDQIAFVLATLEDARRVVPDGHVRMPRDVQDDPLIVETWI